MVTYCKGKTVTMIEPIQEKVGVISIYDNLKRSFRPYKLRWQMREYIITKVAYYHKIREGRTIIHIFHATDGNLDFKLLFNSDTLSWTLAEVYDGSSGP